MTGSRQIGPLADLVANWAPHFLVLWQIGPGQIRPQQIGPLVRQIGLKKVLDHGVQLQCSLEFLHVDLTNHDFFSCIAVGCSIVEYSLHVDFRLQKSQYTLQDAQHTVHVNNQ